MRTSSFRRALPYLLGAVASVACATSASAVTYNVTSVGLDGNPGGLWGVVHYSGSEGPTTNEAAGVGRIVLNYNNMGGGTLHSYCVDLFDWLGSGAFVEKPLAASGYSAFRLSELTNFVTHADALVSAPGATPTMSAAAQLGVWEILYEALGVNNSRPAYDVTSGNFFADGGNLNSGPSADSLALANDWLGKLSDTSSGGWSTPYALSKLNFVDPNSPGLSARNQGQVYTSPAPEPASWAMMIVGFGIVGAATRRRRVRVTIAA
jgi:hypothetical protein